MNKPHETEAHRPGEPEPPRECEDNYRHLFENLNDAVFLADVETGHILDANRQAETLTGRPRDELVGMHQSELHPPGKADEYRQKFAAHIDKGHTVDHDGEIVRKDGTLVPVAISASTSTVGGRHLIIGLFRDISERKRAEAQIAVFRQFAESSGQGLAMATLEGNVTYVNPTLCRILGESSPQDVIGKPLLAYYPEELRHRLQNEILPAVMTRGQWTGELALRSVQGRLTPTIENIFLIRDSDGAPLCLADVMTDITERKRAEDALATSQLRIRALFETIPTALFTVDTSGIITGWNRAAEELTGYGAAEALGDSCLLLQGRPCQETCGAFDDDVEKPIRNTVCTLVRKDGEQRIIRKNVELLRDENGEVVGAVESFVDITEEKRTEEQLRKLVRAVEQSSSAIVITDVNGNIEYVNPRFTEITGYTAQEAIGNNPRLLKAGDHPPEFYKNLWDTITSGGQWHGKFRNKKKSGELYWESASISPITNHEGVITHFLALKDDITERMLTEERLQQQTTELERARYRALNMMEDADLMRRDAEMRADELARMAGRLEQAKREADAASEAKSHFLANMSHEIRTPMNAIIGFSSLLLEEDLTGEQRETVQIITTSGTNLLSLINDILDLSKVEAGHMTLEEVDFSLHMLVNNAANLIRNRCSEKGLTLAVDFADEVPDALRGDEAKVRQVLTNLLSNAAKFAEHGSITINVALRNAMIELAVTDTGIGIPAHKIARIFDPFTQADESTTRRFGGTGLGLTLCKGFAEMLGGDLRVQSTPAKGSTFTFAFPYTAAEGAVTAPGEDQPASVEFAGHGLCVLVAEDDPFNRKYMARLLGSRGFEVQLVANGQEAVRLARQHPDIILMDMHMPVMSGSDATRTLKADAELAHIPVVVLTASAMKEDREKARAAGCDGFAAKPIQLHELFAEMKRVLAAHGTLDATRVTTDAAPATTTDLDDSVHELREEYMAQFDDVLEEFEALAAAGDTAGLGAVGHRIRGNGAPYGFPEITDIGTHIEDLGNAGNLEDILPHIERLRQIRDEFQHAHP